MNKLVVNPYKNIDWNTIGRYKGNYHTHTTESDGSIYGAEVIRRYKEANYDILILTDHDKPELRYNGPNQQPNELGGVGYVNTWPWSIFEGEEPYQAEPGSLHRVLVETAEEVVTGIVANGMLTVEGVEYSNNEHILSYDNAYPGAEGDFDEYLDEDRDRLGITVFAHPTRAGYNLSYFTNRLRKYPNIIGMEVYNNGNRYPDMKPFWDSALMELMPETTCWGFSNDDMHHEHSLFGNYQIMLMEKFDRQAWRKSMFDGAFFFSYEPGRSGKALAPTINSVLVSESAGTIEIHAENHNEIRWIANGNVIHTGYKLDYKNNKEIGGYVRAEVEGDFGITCTNPFGFIKEKGAKQVKEKIVYRSDTYPASMP